MSEAKEEKRFRDRLRKFLKGLIRRGVNLTLEERYGLMVEEMLKFEKDFDQEILQFFSRFLDSSNKNAHDIMVPLPRVVAVSPSMSLNEILDKVVQTGHSRYPIQGDTKDTITGLLHVKDLFAKYREGNSDEFDIESLRRDVVTVYEDLSLVNLLQKFKEKQAHMAVVLDESQKVIGVVTLEDFFEQFFGDIQDEHDQGEEDKKLIEEAEEGGNKLTNGGTNIKADLSIDEFNKHFGTELSNDHSNTIGGYVVTKLGHVPLKGEKTKLDDSEPPLIAEITEATDRKIESLAVSRNDQ